MVAIGIILGLLVGPYLLTWVSEKTKVSDVLSPVVLCYALGIVLRNFTPFGDSLEATATSVSSGAIALALPLIMMNADFRQFLKSSRSILFCFGLALLSVAVVCPLGAYLFFDLADNSREMAAILSGGYTGGTPNMAGIQKAIGAEESLFGVLNMADVIIGGSYLVFLTSLGARFFRSFFPKGTIDNGGIEDDKVDRSRKEKVFSGVLSIGIAIAIVGLTVGLSSILLGKVDDAFLIIGITVLGIAISLTPISKGLFSSYQLGDYLLLVFSIAVGMLSDFEALAASSKVVIQFSGAIMFGSIVLHLLLSRLFKIDSETTMVTSAACIFGPVFVGQVVSVMKNRSMLVPAMAMGVTGYALGSLLGIALYKLMYLLW